MRYFIPLFLILFVLNCNTKKNITTKKVSTNIQQDDYYFAVNFKFTKDSITPISFDKLDGALGYEIFPPTDLFLAAYENNQLIYYAELTNPLQMRVVGDNEKIQTISATEEYLNLPKTFSNKKLSKNRTIMIYKIVNYIENFESIIVSKTNFNGLEKQGYIKQIYNINSMYLATFLTSKN